MHLYAQKAYKDTSQLCFYFLQKVRVKRAKTVKYSKRPTSIAPVNIHVPVSETGAKLAPTSPNPGPRTLTHAATAENALQKSSPVNISNNVNSMLDPAAKVINAITA